MTTTAAPPRREQTVRVAPASLTDAELDARREIGDPEVDALVEQVLDDGMGGRRGYNLMLDVADQVVAAPELLMTQSHLRHTLDAMPGRLRDYFAPQPAPEWVCPEKLALGSSVWSKNMLASLAVLYASSLPACYLIKRGIPALYGSAKLCNPRYIYQRIYETGVMLDGVMSEGGIRVVREAVETGEQRIEQVLEQVDPGSQWTQVGDDLRRQGGGSGHEPGHDQVLAALKQGPGVRRYLYGPGFVAARKVRFLHASMRHLLLEVHDSADTNEEDQRARMCDHLANKQWDASLGAPVNQEDLAFTLLTFGYLIPIGLKRWGVRIDDETRDAFLHTWRVVGHLMGIDDALMTDDWDEAKALYERLHARQAGHSEEGIALTDSLLGFLAEYIPDHFNLGKRIGASMIVDQLGETDARMILPSELVDATRSPIWRVGYLLAITAVRIFYWMRGTVFKHLPLLGRVFTNVLHRTGEELIASWRGAYDRRAFYVPATADKWQLRRGVTDEFMVELRAWRRRVFNATVFAVAGMIGGSVLIGAGLLCWLLSWPAAAMVVSAAGLLGVLLGAGAMEYWMPAVFKKRPRIEDLPHVAAGRGTLGESA